MGKSPLYSRPCPELWKHIKKATDFPDKVKQGYRKMHSFLRSLKTRRNTPYFDIEKDVSILIIEEDKKSSVYLR